MLKFLRLLLEAFRRFPCGSAATEFGRSAAAFTTLAKASGNLFIARVPRTELDVSFGTRSPWPRNHGYAAHAFAADDSNFHALMHVTPLHRLTS